MKQFKFNKLAVRLAGGGLVGLVMAAQSAMACTVGNWDANSNGATPGSVVADSPAAISRYSGLCGMKTAASTAAWVQDESPAGINRIRARFYVLNQLAAGQSAVVYRGFSNNAGTGSLFTVRLETDGRVRLIDNATAVEVEQNSATPWTSIEIDWSQGSGNGVISLSVNGQGPVVQNTLNNTGSALQSVRLGNLLGTAGTLSFDAYESRRSTGIGRLIAGDANNSGSINIADASAIIAELDGTLQIGQPDCNESGNVNISDASCIVSLL